MTDNETPATDQSRVSWDVFFLGDTGLGEHIQVIASEAKTIIEGRPKLLDYLKSIGATTMPRDVQYKTPTPAKTAPAADPMMQAAQQVLGAVVQKTCPIHNSSMKRVAGSAETGRLSKYGKPYPSFWVCEAVEGCRGGER